MPVSTLTVVSLYSVHNVLWMIWITLKITNQIFKLLINLEKVLKVKLLFRFDSQ